MFVSLARLMSPLIQLGVRYHAEASKRWRPCRPASRIAFAVDANSMKVEIDSLKKERGMSLREAILGFVTSPRVSARTLLSRVWYLDFFRWIVRGGFFRLRRL